MRLPVTDQKIEEGHAIKQIRLAIDLGVNYFDTATPYHCGESEIILGKALSDGFRKKVKIATKLTVYLINKPEDMEGFLEAQLRKLRTSYIDYYLLHGLDLNAWKKFQNFNALDFLSKAQKKGKIVNMGFSFHGSKQLFREVVESNDWAMCQMQYNFLDENYQGGTESLHYAASNNLAVMVMEPLRGGLFAKSVPHAVERIYANAKPNRTPAEWGLRWVWNHPEVTVVLSGMNDEKQIAENATVCQTALPNSLNNYELTTIEKVASHYRKLMKVRCTACAYCMPCPNGVNIPFNFELYNMYSLGAKEPSREMYHDLLQNPNNGNPTDASLCKGCGACKNKCPQHINTPLKLKAVQKLFTQTAK